MNGRWRQAARQVRQAAIAARNDRIKADAARGVPVEQIAAETGRSQNYVRRIAGRWNK